MQNSPYRVLYSSIHKESSPHVTCCKAPQVSPLFNKSLIINCSESFRSDRLIFHFYWNLIFGPIKKSRWHTDQTFHIGYRWLNLYRFALAAYFTLDDVWRVQSSDTANSPGTLWKDETNYFTPQRVPMAVFLHAKLGQSPPDFSSVLISILSSPLSRWMWISVYTCEGGAHKHAM